MFPTGLVTQKELEIFAERPPDFQWPFHREESGGHAAEQQGSCGAEDVEPGLGIAVTLHELQVKAASSGSGVFSWKKVKCARLRCISVEITGWILHYCCATCARVKHACQEVPKGQLGNGGKCQEPQQRRIRQPASRPASQGTFSGKEAACFQSVDSSASSLVHLVLESSLTRGGRVNTGDIVPDPSPLSSLSCRYRKTVPLYHCSFESPVGGTWSRALL